MITKDLKAGDVLRHRCGGTVTIVRMVERGAVVVFGSGRHKDIHESLKEWGELKGYEPMSAQSPQSGREEK